jgi:hypothetical protein
MMQVVRHRNAACLLDSPPSVLEVVQAKEFSTVHPWFQEREVKGKAVGEDLTFCMRAQLAGFPVQVHTGIQIGHVKSHVLIAQQYEAQQQMLAQMREEAMSKAPLLNSDRRRGGAVGRDCEDRPGRHRPGPVRCRPRRLRGRVRRRDRVGRAGAGRDLLEHLRDQLDARHRQHHGTVNQTAGRAITPGFTGFYASTSEPTVLTPVDSFTMTPNGGTVIRDYNGATPDSAVSERVRDPVHRPGRGQRPRDHGVRALLEIFA